MRNTLGDPGLGLKRGLDGSLVIAPYATALAATVDPRAATANFDCLTGVGARGRFGFYDAVDYTAARLQLDEAPLIVRAFMAHHQGMSIIAIANVIFDGRMRARFHAEPCIRATELLLHERPPRDVSAVAHITTMRGPISRHICPNSGPLHANATGITAERTALQL